MDRIVLKGHPDPTSDNIDVKVLSQDKNSVAYNMRNPHLRHSCCDCKTAQQQRICHHQVAVLLSLYPHPDTESVVVRMLGTRFGFPGGCTMESLSPLRDELGVLCTSGPASSATRGAGTLMNAEPADASACSPSEHPPLASHRSANAQAITAFRKGKDAKSAEMDQLVACASASQQQRAMEFFSNRLQRAVTEWMRLDLSHVEELQDFPKTSGTSTKRMKSFMEAQKRKKPKQPSAALLAESSALPDLSTSKRPAKLLISKPWAGKNSARQAAAHVSKCLQGRAPAGVQGGGAATMQPTAGNQQRSTLQPAGQLTRASPTTAPAHPTPSIVPCALGGCGPIDANLQKYRRLGPVMAQSIARDMVLAAPTVSDQSSLLHYLRMMSSTDRSMGVLLKSIEDRLGPRDV